MIDNPFVKEVKLGSISLKNINQFSHLYADSNNQSIVLYGKIANLNFLFTGDIDKTVEQKIIAHYTT